MRQQKPAWPTKQPNPFSAGVFTPNSPTWINLEWIKGSINDSATATAFKESGDRIITQLSRQKRRQYHDAMFLPIIYLYRHCFELQMKHIIRTASSLDMLPNREKIDVVLRSHNLFNLWAHIGPVVDAMYPGSSTEMDFINAGRIVRSFHDVDRTGETLRYTQNLNAQKHTYPKYVELKAVRKRCDELYNFLEAIEAALHEASRVLDDMQSWAY